MSRPILSHDRYFHVARNAVLITGSTWTTPITGNGPRKDVRRFRDIRIQFGGAFNTWDLSLEGTLDGDNWINVNTSVGSTVPALITAVGLFELPGFWHGLRLVTNTLGDLASSKIPSVDDVPTFTAALGAFEVGSWE